MTTSVDLTDEELAGLKELTQQATASAAVRAAMLDYLRSARRARLRGLSGRVTMEDNWREFEELELKEAKPGV